MDAWAYGGRVNQLSSSFTSTAGVDAGVGVSVDGVDEASAGSEASVDSGASADPVDAFELSSVDSATSSSTASASDVSDWTEDLTTGFLKNGMILGLTVKMSPGLSRMLVLRICNQPRVCIAVEYEFCEGDDPINPIRTD